MRGNRTFKPRVFVGSKKTNMAIVVVTGTMRSGTSLVCHLLSKCGIDFFGGTPAIPFDELNQERHNPNGYFERLDVHRAYTTLYRVYETKRRAVDLIHDVEPPPNDAAVREFQATMRGIIGVGTGLKCIQLAQNPEFLNDVLPTGSVLIYCYRNRRAVQRSMEEKYSGLTGSCSGVPHAYWKNHHLRFLQKRPRLRYPVLFCSYDELIAHPVEAVSGLTTQLHMLGCDLALTDWVGEVQQSWCHFPHDPSVHTFAERTVMHALEALRLRPDDSTYDKTIASLQLSETATQGSNEPCRCGSTLKYKKCCG